MHQQHHAADAEARALVEGVLGYLKGDDCPYIRKHQIKLAERWRQGYEIVAELEVEG